MKFEINKAYFVWSKCHTRLIGEYQKLYQQVCRQSQEKVTESSHVVENKLKIYTLALHLNSQCHESALQSAQVVKNMLQIYTLVIQKTETICSEFIDRDQSQNRNEQNPRLLLPGRC